MKQLFLIVLLNLDIQLVILINNVSCNSLSNNTSINATSVTNINTSTVTNSNIVIKVKETETIAIKCPIELNLKYDSKSTTRSSTSTTTEEYDTNDYELDEIEDDDNQKEDDDAKLILSSKTIDKREIFSLENNNLKKSNLVIHWYKDGARLNKYKILNTKYKQDGLNLRIRNINLNDSGKYKCKIINGHGGVSYSTVYLEVSALTLSTSTVSGQDLIVKNSKKTSFVLPVFLNPERASQVQFYRRAKGSQIKFKCNARGQPKPDILWYKNGLVLNEEDYGITRSKWTIELKDLRMSDSGNYSCKVFNKFGSINSTFQLNVYDGSDFIETSQPINITIVAGMDAVFNCKLKSLNKPKWMKQISRAEYKNYVIQNNPSELQLLSQLDKLNQPTPKSKLDDVLAEEPKTTSLNDDDESIKSFYVMSTSSPLSPVGTLDKTNDQNDIDLSLSDLIGKDKIDSIEDTTDVGDDNKFNFELFMPNKNQNLNPAKLKVPVSENENAAGGVHYITLSSSPLIIEKQILNKEQNYYINQLIIKQADVKDSGIYVCFGDNAKIVRRAYLKVLPNNNNKIFGENYDEALSKFKEIFENEQNNIKNKDFKQPLTNNNWSFSLTNLHSFSFMIVLIPVAIICSFALISICYLRHLAEQKKKLQKNRNTTNGFFEQLKSCFFKSKKDEIGASGLNCCCPTYTTHVLMHENFSDENETLSNNNKKLRLTNNTSSISSSTVERSTNHHASTLTNSTTATTVAYYTVQVPIMMCDSVTNSPPPPLPNSQPPHITPQSIIPYPQQNQYLNDSHDNDNTIKSSNLERSVSTPSMAYYKIVDCDLIDWNSIKSKNESENKDFDNKETNLTSSTNSRLYYQLTPSKESK